jgi:hypothetical protein
MRSWRNKCFAVAIPVLLIACALIALGAGLAGPAPQKRVQTGSPHGGFIVACGKCHTSTSFAPIRPFPDFDHRNTRFPLQGMHRSLYCRQCHVNLVFSDIGTGCADCHADIHRRQNGNNCARCHTVFGWRQIVRNINGHENNFPLFGAHAAVQCEGCHRNAATGQFLGLNTDCASCHIDDYLGAKSVDHKAAGYSLDCKTCHNSDSWSQSVGHVQLTGFVLEGAHAKLDCAQCHIAGKFSGIPTTCVGCHLQRYNTVKDPNHVQGAFPQDCTLCHSTAAWTPALFDHAKTQFALTGAHATQQCSACHSSGQYAGLPTACVSCHLSRFNSTANPNHVTAGFPKDCNICHSTAVWTPALFDHSTTGFQLTGKHTEVQCSNCHIAGVYAGTPTDCYSCHSKEYASATNPGHVAAGFPRDCTQCHSPSSWSGAVFNHTWFQIYSGTHAGRWTVCGDCHINSNDYSVFSCLTCHAHNRTTTDSQHQGRSNYVYNSANCYSCHSTGRGD